MVDVLESIDAAALRRWAYRCVDSLTARCDEIDALNVFPIPDSDTGTNLMFTPSVPRWSRCAQPGPTADARAIGRALAVGAVAGARGNSGVIVSQLLRAVAEASADGPLDTVSIQAMLRRAKVLVAAAVSVPVEARCSPFWTPPIGRPPLHDANVSLSTLVVDIGEATARAVDSTTDQLAELREAGVVDAGALGLSVIVDALVEVVIGRTPPRRRLPSPTRARTPGGERCVERFVGVRRCTRVCRGTGRVALSGTGGLRRARPERREGGGTSTGSGRHRRFRRGRR